MPYKCIKVNCFYISYIIWVKDLMTYSVKICKNTGIQKNYLSYDILVNEIY